MSSKASFSPLGETLGSWKRRVTIPGHAGMTEDYYVVDTQSGSVAESKVDLSRDGRSMRVASSQSFTGPQGQHADVAPAWTARKVGSGEKTAGNAR